MILIYHHGIKHLFAASVSDLGLKHIGAWACNNNVDSKSRGPWPEGIFPFELYVPVTGNQGKADGSYGPFFFRFTVPGRDGMGIHAGREIKKDGLNRSGPNHATLGCLRTTASAVTQLAELHRRDPIERLVVIRGEDS